MSRYKRLPGKQVLPGASAAAWTVLLFSLLMGALVFHWPADIIWQTRWRNSSQSDSDALIDWIRSNGGVVNVGVRSMAGRGKITVALHDIRKGQELAVIPRKICFAGHLDGEWATAAKLWAELSNIKQSPLQPYLNTLPARSQVWSYYDLPSSYIPLIQNKALETATLKLQEDLQHWHRRGQYQHNSTQQLPKMTLDQLRYSMSLVKTRIFGTQFGQLMVPLIDLANHHNNCKHTITTHPTCEPASEDGCIVWKAGSDLAAGDEVCNIYHESMLQDRAVLQYGFLQDDDWSKQMSSIDRHDYDIHNPWSFSASLEQFSSNNTANLQDEVGRLEALLAEMATLDASLQLSPDGSSDLEAVILGSLMTWRQQRKASIALELRRLRAALLVVQVA